MFCKSKLSAGRFSGIVLFCCLILLLAFQSSGAQSLGAFDRDNAEAMLDAAKEEIKKNYYDSTYRGIDLETRFKEAKDKLKQATTRDQLMSIIAQAVLEFNDSHTFFLPPARAAKIDYGWRVQMIGNDCYVIGVKPRSDAETKGLKVGDQILSVDGYSPTRGNLWKMLYRYYVLAPARGVRLTVRSPEETEPRKLEVLTKIEPSGSVVELEQLYVRYLSAGADLYEDRFYEFGKDLIIWKMPEFSVSPDHIDDIMGRARNFKSLILDLRGNGGGYVKTLERLTGYFFDRDIKIADMKGRKESKPQIAKTMGDKGFKGKLIVLIDSNSASASELFARTIQLEKRGTILGDHTAGAVMTSRYFDRQTGVGSVLYFGVSVTIADVIMSDGKSLENVGVTPDEMLLLTGSDMANKRDTVLAKAAAMVGVNLDPAKAGEMFPIKWSK